MTNIFAYPHTVTAEEIDEQGHANNVVYVAWMQAAAIAHSATLGWTAQRYLELGMGWVARRHTIEYIRPAYEGDEIVVQTHVADMKRATSTRLYRIIRRGPGSGQVHVFGQPVSAECVVTPKNGPVPCRLADGELLAKAETHWAFISYATGKPTRIPAEISNAFPLANC